MYLNGAMGSLVPGVDFPAAGGCGVGWTGEGMGYVLYTYLGLDGEGWMGKVRVLDIMGGWRVDGRSWMGDSEEWNVRVSFRRKGSRGGGYKYSLFQWALSFLTISIYQLLYYNPADIISKSIYSTPYLPTYKVSISLHSPMAPLQISKTLPTTAAATTRMQFDPNSNSFPLRKDLPAIPGAPKGAAWFWGADDQVSQPTSASKIYIFQVVI